MSTICALCEQIPDPDIGMGKENVCQSCWERCEWKIKCRYCHGNVNPITEMCMKNCKELTFSKLCRLM